MGDDEGMVDDIEEEGVDSLVDESVSTSPSKIIKILFYVVGAIVLFFVIIAVSYFVTKSVQEKKYDREQAIVVAPPPPPLAHYDLPSFSVTTRDAEPHFVKVTISLGYEENIALNAELVKRNPQFQHIINIMLSGKKHEDLNSTEEKINLAYEIKSHINAILVYGKIKEVYFREIVIN